MSKRYGKQIAVAMTERDERDFLAFLRSTGELQILAIDSPSPDAVWLEQFPPRRTSDTLSRRFALWNKAFTWTPQFQVHAHGAGVVNTSGAPIIEYARHPFFKPSPDTGRLYWPRSTGTDEAKAADAAFAPWWSSVQDWVKARSHHRSGEDAHVHYLPWAWWQYGKWGRG